MMHFKVEKFVMALSLSVSNLSYFHAKCSRMIPLLMSTLMLVVIISVVMS